MTARNRLDVHACSPPPWRPRRGWRQQKPRVVPVGGPGRPVSPALRRLAQQTPPASARHFARVLVGLSFRPTGGGRQGTSSRTPRSKYPRAMEWTAPGFSGPGSSSSSRDLEAVKEGRQGPRNTRLSATPPLAASSTTRSGPGGPTPEVCRPEQRLIRATVDSR